MANYKQYKDESLEIIKSLLDGSNMSDFIKSELMSIVRNHKEQNEEVINSKSKTILNQAQEILRQMLIRNDLRYRLKLMYIAYAIQLLAFIIMVIK